MKIHKEQIVLIFLIVISITSLSAAFYFFKAYSSLKSEMNQKKQIPPLPLIDKTKTYLDLKSYLKTEMSSSEFAKNHLQILAINNVTDLGKINWRIENSFWSSENKFFTSQLCKEIHVALMHDCNQVEDSIELVIQKTALFQEIFPIRNKEGTTPDPTDTANYYTTLMEVFGDYKNSLQKIYQLVDYSEIGNNQPTNSVTPTESAHKDCVNYIDKKAGFSLHCPTNVFLGKSIRTNIFSLEITSHSIDTLDEPMKYDKATAIEDQAALAQGQFGEHIDFPINESKKVIKIGNIYAKSFIVFQRFATSDVTFERKLIFYKNGFQTVITLTADTESMIQSMPQYFLEYRQSNNTIWSSDTQRQLYQALIAGKASSEANSWYKTFDDIVKTIELL